jgi:hypothetical protein
MGIDLKLHLDQRSLAKSKLILLPQVSPLREKYEAWITELNARILADEVARGDAGGSTTTHA